LEARCLQETVRKKKIGRKTILSGDEAPLGWIISHKDGNAPPLLRPWWLPCREGPLPVVLSARENLLV
jgi:hypothetical protein